MIKEQLVRYISQNKTLLGIGPMSKNCVDAAIEIGNEYNIPIMLIASRRQIDSHEFGGGYVNNWTTSQYSEYVLNKDKRGNILLCRDHGGPWQSNVEKEQNMGLRRAMESAKISFRKDIEADFQIIHIDPSIDIHYKPTTEEIVDRVLELYEFCWETALENNRRIQFEIGTEEQSGSTSGAKEFEKMLRRVNRYCEKYHMPTPLFVVVQNGTKVLEMQNVGSFDVPVRIADEIPPEIQVPIMSRICRENGVYMKVHNSDYLSDNSLQWYPRLGIHAANIAPEFGVTETKAFINLLQSEGLDNILEQFIDLSVMSNKWSKWMKNNSKASKMDKAIIAGHYVFSTDEYQDLYKQTAEYLSKKKIDLNDYLRNAIKDSILRCLVDFRMVKR